jgi:hypothetical protein
MKRWPFALVSYTPAEVQEFCVQDEIWQECRRDMKGLSTEDKLNVLDAYRFNRDLIHNGLQRRHEVQISNYLNALKRGGLLNMQLEVIK